MWVDMYVIYAVLFGAGVITLGMLILLRIIWVLTTPVKQGQK